MEKSFFIAKDRDLDIVQYKFVLKKNNYKIYDEKTNDSVIFQPELKEQMYYGKGKLKQTNHYIFNKIIKKIIFLKALKFIDDDTLKINLYTTFFCIKSCKFFIIY